MFRSGASQKGYSAVFLECLLCLLHASFVSRPLAATEGVLSNAQLRELQDMKIFPVTNIHLCMKYAHRFNSVKIMDHSLRNSAN